jgi:hypothetical protein
MDYQSRFPESPYKKPLANAQNLNTIMAITSLLEFLIIAYLIVR